MNTSTKQVFFAQLDVYLLLFPVPGEHRGQLHRSVADGHVDAPRHPPLDHPPEVGVLRRLRGRPGTSHIGRLHFNSYTLSYLLLYGTAVSTSICRHHMCV